MDLRPIALFPVKEAYVHQSPVCAGLLVLVIIVDISILAIVVRGHFSQNVE